MQSIDWVQWTGPYLLTAAQAVDDPESNDAHTGRAFLEDNSIAVIHTTQGSLISRVSLGHHHSKNGDPLIAFDSSFNRLFVAAERGQSIGFVSVVDTTYWSRTVIDSVVSPVAVSLSSNDSRFLVAGRFQQYLFGSLAPIKVLSTNTPTDPGETTSIQLSDDGQWAVITAENTGTTYHKTNSLHQYSPPNVPETSAVLATVKRNIVAEISPQGGRLWNTHTNTTIRTLQQPTLPTHVSSLGTIVFSDDGSKIAHVEPNSQTIQVWDTQTGHRICSLTLALLQDSNSSLLFSPDNTKLNVGSTSIDIRQCSILAPLPPRTQAVSWINKDTLVICENNLSKGVAYIDQWEPSSGKTISPTWYIPCTNEVVLSPDKHLAYCLASGIVHVTRLRDGKTLHLATYKDNQRNGLVVWDDSSHYDGNDGAAACVPGATGPQGEYEPGLLKTFLNAQ